MNKIEQLIEDMEQYVDSCKTQTFNSRKVIIDRGAFDDFITDLRMSLPDEIERSKKIVHNKESILNDARVQADKILTDAADRTNTMIDESDIVQYARQQAQMIMEEAQEQAQSLIDRTYQECEGFKNNTMYYAATTMQQLRSMFEDNMTATRELFEQHLVSINDQYQTVVANQEALLASMQADPSQEKAEQTETEANREEEASEE